MSIKPLPCALFAVAAALSGCDKPAATAAAPELAPTELAALHTPPPDYPVELACAGIGGKTVLKVTIGVTGTVSAVELLQGSGQAALDEAASRRVREDWKFKAATRNGQPVAQTIQVPVDFNPPVPKPDGCFAIQERQQRH